MSHPEPTLDVCLEGLPGPMRERIRRSRRVAIRQTGPHGRPQILHPVRGLRGEPQFEVWEQEQKQLGSGGNGCVVVLQSKASPPPPPPPASPGRPPEHRAVKIIPVDDKRWKYYLRELDALIRFSDSKYGDSFVSFLGWYKFDYEDQLFIITEYCENGDLRSYLRAQPHCRLPEREVRDIAWQVLRALQIMHGEECIHGDIKLNNVLIAQRPPAVWRVKVCDLGLSKRVEQAAGGNASTSINFSPGYCPPEKTPIYDNHENIDGYKADMWCLGELVLQALTGKPSFKNSKDLYTWCRTGEGYPDQLLQELHVSEGAVDFLHSAMSCEPAGRPTAEAACGHSWWGDLGTRPVLRARRPSPALSPPQPRPMPRRSAPDVRIQPGVPDAWRRASPRYHYSDAHYALPSAPLLPQGPGVGAHDHSAPPLNYYPYDIEVYQSPSRRLSAPHPPAPLVAPLYQWPSGSDPVPRTGLDLHHKQYTRAPPNNDSPRSSTPSPDRPEVLRQASNSQRRRADMTPGLYYNTTYYGPPQQDNDRRKQVRFVDGPTAHEPSLQEGDHEHQVLMTRGQSTTSKASAPPDQKGLGRALTPGYFTIDTTGQPVHIIVRPASSKPKKKRQQPAKMVDPVATPEGSLAGRGACSARARVDIISREAARLQHVPGDNKDDPCTDAIARPALEYGEVEGTQRIGFSTSKPQERGR